MDMQTEDQSLNASRVETIAAKTDVCACVYGKPFAACAPQLEKGAFHMRSSLESRAEKIAICKQATDRRDRQTDGVRAAD